ncbi:MAG: ROK family protein [Bacteroidales bacterium]|jgi:predicted NBD/HSP70 family sugar kinase|nr:ROK family protein [Bacteroidales bacterium]
MADIKNDSRIVLTLDAGGTNMVFGAMKGGEYYGDTLTLPSNASNLDLCLQAMVLGFGTIIERLGDEKPVAISFAFPGPADYPNGIIGGFLPNFPSFRDGVALGPFLQKKFGVPVFINNDGDLYAYGEALGGALPEINKRLEEAGSSKRYHNLIGYTFGTGFGIGTVIDGRLNRGDNSCVETFCLKHPDMPDVIVEDGVAIRAVKRVFGEQSGNPNHGLEPKEIGAIARGDAPGDQAAAIKAFDKMGEVAGDAIATAVTLIDGLVVIGGGIMNNYQFLMPGILRTMRGKMRQLSGDVLDRVQMKVYNLDDPAEFVNFAKGEARKLKIYGSDDEVVYDPQKRIGVMRSKIGASKAISLGAYAFALSELDK